MYIARIANRNSPPALLLRESYREGDKVKTRTLANFSHLPAEQIEMLRRVFAGETLVPKAAAKGAPSFAIERSLGHGHVAAVLGAMRKLKLDELLPRRPDRLGKLIQAMIVARILEPAPKLATARQLSARTAAHSLGAVLELSDVDEDELYEALDLLAGHQNRLEEALARRHLKDGTLVLYASVRAISKDGTASWLSLAIAATTGATGCKSSTGSCARRRDVRWRSRSSRATPAIPRRLRRKSSSSRSVSI